MTDVVTIGAITAAALPCGAEAIKTVVGEGAKDSYKCLKDLVSSWSNEQVSRLELDPSSEDRRSAVAVAIDNRGEDEKAKVIRMAHALIKELSSAAKLGPIGVDIGLLEASNVRLNDIVVKDGIELRAAHVTAQNFTMESIILGKTKR